MVGYSTKGWRENVQFILMSEKKSLWNNSINICSFINFETLYVYSIFLDGNLIFVKKEHWAGLLKYTIPPYDLFTIL